MPTESLQYAPCFPSFQCARLSVPLNWNASIGDEDYGFSAAIAIIKLPAKVPVTDPRYGGAIIFNPGGPGESGIYEATQDGKNLQALVDSSDINTPMDGKYFDILSFDPRGVNNTTPRLRCFPSAFNQQSWLLRLPDYGLLWHSESIIGMEWARAEALGTSCSSNEDERGILRYLNTAQVAEDMLRIIEKEGEWRETEAKRLLSISREIDTKDLDEVIQRTAYRPGQELIQYWGMSYGTLLGATFAAMHPERIGRMILDGVVDPADHYAGRWLTQLQDSDMIISKFCEYCFLAGPDICPIYTGSSAADVEARFTSIMFSLKDDPIAIPPPDGGNSGPELITYGDAHLSLFSGMYFPFAVADTLFDIVLAVETRNVSSPALASIAAKKQVGLIPSECGEGTLGLGGCVPYVSGMGAFQTISCMDSGGGPGNLSRGEFNEYVAVAHAQSRWISPSWARNKLSCLGFTVAPAWKPALGFETQQWENTSFPLLIIGNSHDTVTPVRNARRVSTLFPGSVVLQQDAEGHCSHSTPSLCTARQIREYFQRGSLPKEGTICDPEVRPFLGCVGSGDHDAGGCHFTDSEDAKLWDTMVGLADPFGLR
ncbi:Fc.00g106310.m01.CDS01 [Cosmosporella sp. VM-42]